MGMIVYNGESSKDYGIFVEHQPKYTVSKRIYNSSAVPGRNGNVILDTGSFENVKKSYDIATVAAVDETFYSAAARISDWLHSGYGYCRLEDSYEPDIFRMAYYEGPLDIENILHRAGRATIDFECKPQRFLKSGEIPIITQWPADQSSAVVIKFNSPRTYDFFPLIKINLEPAHSTSESFNSIDMDIFINNSDDTASSSSEWDYHMSLRNTYNLNTTTTAIKHGERKIYLDFETDSMYQNNSEQSDGILLFNSCINWYSKIPVFKKGPTTIQIRKKSPTDAGEELFNFTSVEIIPRWWII